MTDKPNQQLPGYIKSLLFVGSLCLFGGAMSMIGARIIDTIWEKNATPIVIEKRITIDATECGDLNA